MPFCVFLLHATVGLLGLLEADPQLHERLCPSVDRVVVKTRTSGPHLSSRHFFPSAPFILLHANLVALILHLFLHATHLPPCPSFPCPPHPSPRLCCPFMSLILLHATHPPYASHSLSFHSSFLTTIISLYVSDLPVLHSTFTSLIPPIHVTHHHHHPICFTFSSSSFLCGHLNLEVGGSSI